MKVDFFIVGAPKCGTTSLARYLGEHKQICFSVPKEVHFFTADLLGVEGVCKARSVEEYHQLFFSHYDRRIHRVVGEGSANYLFFDQAVPRILDYNADAKLIVMLRNPVDLLVSFHSQLLKSMEEDVADLETAWALQEERSQGRSLPNVPRFYRDFLRYRDVAMLGDQVERLLSVVDRSNVRFYLLEDFSLDPRAVYKDVCRFLGVSDDGRDHFEKENVRMSWRSDKIREMYLNLARVKNALFGFRALPFQLEQRIRHRFLTPNASRQIGVSESFRLILKNEYRDDISKLSSLINRDLSGWVNG